VTTISGAATTTSGYDTSNNTSQPLTALLAILQGNQTGLDNEAQVSHRLEMDFIKGFMQDNQRDFYLFSDVFEGL